MAGKYARVHLERINDESYRHHVGGSGHAALRPITGFQGGGGGGVGGTATPHRTDRRLIVVRDPNYETPPAQRDVSRRPLPFGQHNGTAAPNPSAQSGFLGLLTDSPSRGSASKGPMRYLNGALGSRGPLHASTDAESMVNSENNMTAVSAQFRPQHVTHAYTPSKSEHTSRQSAAIRPHMLSPVRGPAAGHSPSRGHSGLPSSPGGGHHHRPTSGHLQKSHPEGRKRLGNVGGHTHQSPSHHVEYPKHHQPIRQPSHSPSRAREVLTSATTNSSAGDMSPLMTRSDSQSSPEKMTGGSYRQAPVFPHKNRPRHRQQHEEEEEEIEEGYEEEQPEIPEDESHPPTEERDPSPIKQPRNRERTQRHPHHRQNVPSGLERSREPVVADNEDDAEQINNATTSSSSHHHHQQKPSRGESRQQIDTGDSTGQSGGEGAGEHGPHSGAASAAPSSGNGGHDDDVFKVPRAPPPPAASAAAKKKQQTRHLVASPQLDSSVNELYDKAMYLTSWVPILRKGNGLVIEGDVLDVGSFEKDGNDGAKKAAEGERGGAKPEKWRSGKITGRVNARLLESSSGRPYVIEGALDLDTAEKRNVPVFIWRRFKNGFPPNWESLVENWRNFEIQQKKMTSFDSREETMTNYGCSSCLVNTVNTTAANSTVAAVPVVADGGPKGNQGQTLNGGRRRSNEEQDGDCTTTSQDDDDGNPPDGPSPVKRSRTATEVAPTATSTAQLEETEIVSGSVHPVQASKSKNAVGKPFKQATSKKELQKLLDSAYEVRSDLTDGGGGTEPEDQDGGGPRRSRRGPVPRRDRSLESNASSQHTTTSHPPSKPVSKKGAKRRSDQSASEASKHLGRTKKVNPPNKPKTKASRKKPSTKVDVEINQPKARLSDSSSEADSDNQGGLPAQRGKQNHQSQVKASDKKKPPTKQRSKEEENLPLRRGGQGPKKTTAKEAPRIRPARGASSQSEPDHQQSDEDEVPPKKKGKKKPGSKPTAKQVAPAPAVSLSELSKNPKTLKAIRKNSEVLKVLSQGDPEGEDYFASNNRKAGGKSKQQRPAPASVKAKQKEKNKGGGGKKRVSGGAAQIEEEMFGSDSENEMMSMHSARTPIHSYLGIGSTATTPAMNDDEAVPDPDSAYSRSAKAVEQLIYRKMHEKKRMERQQRVAATASHDSLMKPSKGPVKGRRETEREADQLGRPISKYLQQAQNHQQDDEDSDEMEEYFSEAEEEYRSLNNEPDGIRQLADRNRR